MATQEMKDSGLEWLGEIPSAWKIRKISSFYSLRSQKVSDKDYQPLSVTMNGILPQLENVAKTDNGNNRKLVRKGDFVINSRSDRRGACGISPYDGSVSVINTVLTPFDKAEPRYFNWLFHTENFADEFYKWGNGIVDDLWSTRWQEMKKISIPVPSINEQIAIANFLDAKCAEIDALISDIEKQIETLQKYKKSVITEAVTKGLDSNVEMRASRVEWIGLFPSTWTITKIKNIATLSSGTTPNRSNPEYWNGNIPWVKTGELKETYITEIEERISELALRNTSLKIYPKNTLLMAMYGQGKTRGMTGCLTENSAINQACLAFTNLKDIYRDYLWLVLRAIYEPIRSTALGSGQPNLNSDLVSNFHIPLPDLSEQVQIAKITQKKLLKIEEIIEYKMKQFRTLNTYKQSLIYEYVTGKKTVPNA